MSAWVAPMAALALLVVNGSFVAFEFALVGARPSRLAALAEEGRRSATLALAALRRLDAELVVAQLGITLTTLALGWVAGTLVVDALDGLLGRTPLPAGVASALAVVLGLGLVVVVQMVVGELVPRSVAATAPERTLAVLVRPSRWFGAVARPTVRLATGVASRLAGALADPASRAPGEAVGREGLLAMLEQSRRQGAIERGAQRLLAGVLEFGGGTVASVMVPWAEVSSLTTAMTVTEAGQVVAASGHSRLPVLEPDGRPVGFVHAKDLLALSPAAASLRLPLRLVRRAAVVEPDQPLEDLLVRMRSTGVHLSLVAGSLVAGSPISGEASVTPVGLVTLEDLLGELLGDLDG